MYAWNQWHFQHQVRQGLDPFRSEALFVPTGPVDLGLHNATAFLGLLALPLQPSLGVVGAFNVVVLVLFVLNAWAMFALADRVSRDGAAAWIAGVVFAASAFLTARSTAHMSLVAAAPLPLLLLLLLRLEDQRRVRDAILVGLTLAWALYCDPYYAVFCVVMTAAWVLHAQLEVVRGSFAAPPRLLRVLDAVLVVLALVVFVIALTGGTEFRLAGVRVMLRSPSTPVLLLVSVGLARLLLSRGIGFRRRPSWPLATLARLTLAAGAVAALLSLPFLGAIARSLAAGEFVSPDIPWRSSPPGVDLLAFLGINPSHPLFGAPSRAWLQRLRADGFEENAAALGIVAIAVVLAAARLRLTLPARWVFLFVSFGLLALGPFVQVAGINTRVPTPWTLLRYVPGIGMARSPARFSVLALLAFTVLFACALAALRARWPRHRHALTAVVALLVVAESSPVPRPLFSAEIPRVYRRIADDPRDVTVLVLPTGLRDGTRSVGDFSAVTQFQQIAHGKPLVGGGYLSRVSDTRVAAARRFPILDVLYDLSAGKDVTPDVLRRAHGSQATFLETSRLGWVVIDTARTTREQRRILIHLLGLQRVDRHGAFDLLAPTPPQERRSRRRPDSFRQ